MREQKKASFWEFREEFLDEMISLLILEIWIKDRVSYSERTKGMDRSFLESGKEYSESGKQ